jgi:hypothetical protein
VPITLNQYADNGRVYRAVFSHDRTKAEFKLDFPKPFNKTDHFTIFWNGIIDHQRLADFMDSVWEKSELVATLFFFAHAELCLPPRPVNKIPSPLAGC